jgi:DNA polymerase III subunit gamma/tau
MSYLVLARKFRPLSFKDVSGQTHVTRTLTNSIVRNKVAHAYLFIGPKGVGKTSIARIFAKCLNCERGSVVEPCLECQSCIEIARGSNLAVREIDGASHNSVDDVRDLIESFRSVPPPGAQYKIYIIDEVHMLSTSAFNALLKSLEEPPPHTVFILATTDPQKIPETVLSRCQRHDLKSLPLSEIIDCLTAIAAKEEVQYEDAAIEMIARIADGSLRDAQTLLERVIAYCEKKITTSEVADVLGVTPSELLNNLGSEIKKGNFKGALLALGQIFSLGVDIGYLIKEFSDWWHSELKKVSEFNLGDSSELKWLLQIVEDVRQGADEALRSAFPRQCLEALVVRLCLKVADNKTSNILVDNNINDENLPKKSADPSQSNDAIQDIVSHFNWLRFVEHAKEKAGAMMAEQLRRVVLENFSNGRLVIRAPSIVEKYLSDPKNMSRVLNLLETFLTVPDVAQGEKSSVKAWKIDIVRGENSNFTGGSLHAQSIVERVNTQVEKQNALKVHPKVRSIKEAFPGSEFNFTPSIE